MIKAIAFILAATGLQAPTSELPEVRYTSALALNLFGSVGGAGAVCGAFLPEQNLIVLRRNAGESYAVHELVHWVQAANGIPPGAEAERQAYAVQDAWRELYGPPANGCD